MTTARYENIFTHVVICTLESCRSPNGVPTFSQPFSAYAITEPWVVGNFIEDGINSLQLKAIEAHPDHPEMQMPSLDAADYVLFTKKGDKVETFEALDWTPYEDLTELPFGIVKNGYAARCILVYAP